MGTDRITAVHVRGLRCLHDVALALEGLTVMIGANGSGKSTLVEACEILRKAGSERQFLRRMYEDHCGAGNLFELGGRDLVLSVDVRLAYPLEFGAEVLRYELALRLIPPGTLQITREAVRGLDASGAQPSLLLSRDVSGGYTIFDPGTGRPFDPATRTVSDLELALDSARSVPAFNRVFAVLSDALAAIEVYPSPDVRPSWVTRANSGARAANVVRTVDRIEPDGSNLANVYFELRRSPDYPRVLEDIQLGLGSDFDEVDLGSSPAGSQIALGLRLRRRGVVPASALSDGQLAYLLQVAIVHHRRLRPPSLVVLDEPELHAHPGLAIRIAGLLETMAETQPVLSTTQSDALLDALRAPAESVVLCERDPSFFTQLRRAEAGELRAWLERYRGVGDLRRNGYERLAFDRLISRASDGT